MTTILYEGYFARALFTAARTRVWASSQEFQKPVEASQVLQMVVGVSKRSQSKFFGKRGEYLPGKFRLVIQLRTEREPRKETTIREFVVSVATKPVTSLAREL